MKFRDLTARKLTKLLRRGNPINLKGAAYELAKRIESGPRKCCIPKAKLRRAGLLPAVGALVDCKQPADPEEWPGCIISDGETFLMLTRRVKEGDQLDGEPIETNNGNRWWAVTYPDGKHKIPALVYPENTFKWYRLKNPCLCESAPSPAKS